MLTSRILGGLAIEAGFDVKISEVHGMAQRGGSVVTYVRYGEAVAEPIVEAGQADILIREIGSIALCALPEERRNPYY